MAMDREQGRRAGARRAGVMFEAVEPRQLMASGPGSGVFVGPLQVDNGGGESAITVRLRSGSSLSTRSGDKSPLFDFKDSYYLQNGIDPTKIIGRPSGTGNSVIDNTGRDPTRRNVRVKQAVGMYDEDGRPTFFSVFGLINPNAFTNNAAGQEAREIADEYVAYIFPRAGTNPLGLAKRQDDIAPLNHGYFSNNPLGIWKMAFVNFVPGSMNSGEGRELAQELIARNGTDTDGTPFIRDMDELDDALDAGIVTVKYRASDGSQGQPWFFCPVYKDTRNGAIARDATLAVVRNADGTVHQSSKPIERLFLEMQAQGAGGTPGSLG